MSQLLLLSGSQGQESFNTRLFNQDIENEPAVRGATAMPSAHALFGYVGGIVLGETLCVPFAHQAWTEAGYFFDGEFEDHIQSVSKAKATWRIY